MLKKWLENGQKQKMTMKNLFRTFYFQSINIKNENWTKYNRDSLSSVVRGNKNPFVVNGPLWTILLPLITHCNESQLFLSDSHFLMSSI